MANIDIADPGIAAPDLDLALCVNRPAVDWYDQDNGSPSDGTIDITDGPYGMDAAEGDSTLIGFPDDPEDSGIWVLGSVVVPSAVPVTRRNDSIVGKVFNLGEVIRLNPANAVSNGCNSAIVIPYDSGYSNTQSIGVIGTDILECNLRNDSGEYSTVGGGVYNQATGDKSTVAGGRVCVASGDRAVVSGGSNNTASGQRSTVSGGQNNTADGINSYIPGGQQATTREIRGASAYATGTFGVQGDQQRGSYLLAISTSGATPTELTSDSDTGQPTNHVVLPNNSSYLFRGMVVGRNLANGDTTSWTFVGAVKRGANAAATALVAPIVPTLIAQDAGLAATDLDVTADTTNGGVSVVVTGLDATSMQWVGSVDTIETVGITL